MIAKGVLKCGHLSLADKKTKTADCRCVSRTDITVVPQYWIKITRDQCFFNEGGLLKNAETPHLSPQSLTSLPTTSGLFYICVCVCVYINNSTWYDFTHTYIKTHCYLITTSQHGSINTFKQLFTEKMAACLFLILPAAFWKLGWWHFSRLDRNRMI